GNVVLTGGFSTSADFGAGPVTGNSGGGIFVAAYDPSGNYLWAKTTGGGTDVGRAVRIDSNGNLVLAGTSAYGIYFGVPPVLGGNGQPNGFCAAFTISGNTPPSNRWREVLGYGTDGASGGNAIALTLSGDVLFGGTFMATID